MEWLLRHCALNGLAFLAILVVAVVLDRCVHACKQRGISPAVVWPLHIVAIGLLLLDLALLIYIASAPVMAMTTCA